MGGGRGGPAVPRHAGRLLGAQLRPPPSRADRGRAPPAGPAHADLARVPQRPARRVRRAAGRADRPRHGAAHEHRRGGGGERDQGGPQVGLRREGRPGRPGDDRGGGGQLPRPYDDDRELLDGRGGARRFRPLHPGLPGRSLQRPRGAGGGGRRDDGRGADRADPGRGGRRRPGRRLSGGRAGADAPQGMPVHRGRDPVGAGPHGPHARRGARVGPPGRGPARQGAGRRHRPGVGGGRPARGAPGAPPRGARVDLRRQSAGRGGRYGRGGAAGDG